MKRRKKGMKEGDETMRGKAETSRVDKGGKERRRGEELKVEQGRRI